MFLNYNLGSKDITIGDIATKVNDGRYHVVRFSRSDINSTLQVDDNPVHSKYPQGKNHCFIGRNLNWIWIKHTIEWLKVFYYTSFLNIKFSNYKFAKFILLTDFSIHHFLHSLGNKQQVKTTVFNDQSLVQLGGRYNPTTRRIDRPFVGIIAGAVYNGLRPLDLVK